MTVGRRFVVIGRVQGVGFRYFVVQVAQELEVRGSVRNVADGSVEVIAEGTERSMAALRKALERGPAYSNVVEVKETRSEVTSGYEGFRVIY